MTDKESIFSKARQAFLLSFKHATVVLHENFFTSTDVMSPEAKKILANPEDRKKYFEAVQRLKTKETEEEDLEFSDKKKMTLTFNE